MDANAIHALDLLTEDCWREVFKLVRGPEDLKSCSEVCTTFEGILWEKRNVWMFPAILSHILPYLGDTIKGDWNPLYTCRLICRGWCQAIDSYLETHNNCSYFSDGFILPTYDYNFLSEEDDSEKFLEIYKDHVGNPFIGRFMSVESLGMLALAPVEANEDDDDYADDEERAYMENIYNILVRFGSEIRSLSLELSWRQLTFCKNISILLGMLPNLKSLQLGDGSADGSPSELEESYEEDEINQLPAFLTANPLPDHPNLKHLVVHTLSTRMARPLLEKYGQQLTRLQLYNPVVFVATVQHFRCLKELEIWSFDPGDSLQALSQLQSPLETLHVRVDLDDYDGPSRTWPIDGLIRNIQHLPVTELQISTRAPLEQKLDAFPASLQHVTIRRVRITSYIGCSQSQSCNFLRCFPNMEDVHIKVHIVYSYPGMPKAKAGNQESLIVSNDMDGMYEQPIWDVLPHLQTILVSVFHQTFMYEYVKAETSQYRRSTFETLLLEKTKEILAPLF